MQIITYNGNHVFRNINFNLYGYDDINFEETKEQIFQSFELEYSEIVKCKLREVGLEFVKFKWFSPKEYNFSGDSIDLEITVVDKDKFKKFILENKEKINLLLTKNKSYDGYIKLTVDNVEKEIDKLESDNYEPDIIVLGEILNIDCNNFNIFDYFVFEEQKEKYNKWRRS